MYRCGEALPTRMIFITRLPDGYNTMLTANGANLRRVSGSCCPSPARQWPTRLL